MFYRKDLLAAASMPEPTTSWTWGRVLDIREEADARPQRRRDHRSVWIRHFRSLCLSVTSPYVRQNGVGFVDEDRNVATANDPAVIEGHPVLLDLIRTHKVRRRA